MADIVNGFVKGLFGGQKPVKAPVAGDDGKH